MAIMERAEARGIRSTAAGCKRQSEKLDKQRSKSFSPSRKITAETNRNLILSKFRSRLSLQRNCKSGIDAANANASLYLDDTFFFFLLIGEAKNCRYRGANRLKIPSTARRLARFRRCER